MQERRKAQDLMLTTFNDKNQAGKKGRKRKTRSERGIKKERMEEKEAENRAKAGAQDQAQERGRAEALREIGAPSSFRVVGGKDDGGCR
jgi:hypothetical protein